MRDSRITDAARTIHLTMAANDKQPQVSEQDRDMERATARELVSLFGLRAAAGILGCGREALARYLGGAAVRTGTELQIRAGLRAVMARAAIVAPNTGEGEARGSPPGADDTAARDPAPCQTDSQASR